jgi:hypothetical protein
MTIEGLFGSIKSMFDREMTFIIANKNFKITITNFDHL